MVDPKRRKQGLEGLDFQSFGLKPVKHNPNLARASKKASDAIKVIKEHATNEWDASNGAVLRQAELVAEKWRAEADRLQKQLTRLRDVRAVHATRINMARHHTTDADAPAGKDIPFGEWNQYDKLIAGLSLFSSASLLGLGAVNVATTILASGIPVFLEQPYLAWMLSALVPAAALAVKSGYHLLDWDTSRKAYSLGMFGLSGVLIFIWIILFVFSFEGATADIDWDVLNGDFTDQQDHSLVGKLRNAVQIIAEVVIGASLFLVYDRRQARCSASYSMKNPKWNEADKQVKELEGPALDAEKTAVADEARAVQIRAVRDVFVGEAVGDLRDMQSRD
ncbi:MAG: hypothetical protein AAFW83_01670 [Pseudomonadota bacterium]